VAALLGIQWWTYRLSTPSPMTPSSRRTSVNVAPEMVSARIVRFLVEENDGWSRVKYWRR